MYLCITEYNPNKKGGQQRCKLRTHESQEGVGHKGNRFPSYHMPPETWELPAENI